MKTSFWLFGSEHEILVNGKDSGQENDLIQKRSKAGAKTPLHIHGGYSEMIIVREGQLTINMADKNVVLNPGESYLIAKGIVHSLASTVLEGETITLQRFKPGGFAQLLAAMGTAENQPDQSKFDMVRFNQLSAALGDVTLG
jgi:anti-sigma factor ChrR (cupin superfamily)